MKRKKLRRKPVRKARLSLKEIQGLVWDTLFSDFDRPWWVHGKVSTGSKAAGRKIPSLRTSESGSDPFLPFPITRDVYALPVWKQQILFRIYRRRAERRIEKMRPLGYTEQQYLEWLKQSRV